MNLNQLKTRLYKYIYQGQYKLGYLTFLKVNKNQFNQGKINSSLCLH